MSVFAVLTAIYAVRHTFDKKFRDSRKDNAQMTFFICFWITAAVFYLRPTGLDTRLPAMNVKSEKVGVLLGRWGKKLPNVKLDCRKVVAEKRISINTITPITIGEALDIISKKADAGYDFTQDARGRSIAGGPRIDVKIYPVKQRPSGPGDYFGPE
jgi:hypothetical protein